MLLPLRWLLLGPALLILLGALLAMGWTGHRSVEVAVQRSEQAQAAEIAAALAEHLDDAFHDVAEAADAVRDGLRRDWLQPQAKDLLMQFSAHKLRYHPVIGALEVGFADGGESAALRDPGSAALLGLRAGPDGIRQLSYLAADSDLPLADGTRVLPAQDVRRQPWYHRAATALRPVWNEIAPQTLDAAPALSISVPLLRADGGGLLGVAKAEMGLAELSQLLAEGFRERAGLALLTDGRGRLVARSGSMPLPAELQAELGRAQDAAQRFVRIGGQRYALDLRRVDLPHGLSLMLAVFVSDAELQGTVDARLRQAILSGLLVALLGGAALALLLRGVQRRVEGISAAAERLAAGQRDARAPDGAPVAELRTLSQSFNRMGNQLESVLLGLEAEVEARTHALAQANAELERQVALDGLTQIANRRHFDTQFALAWRRCQREQRPLALVMADVDHFKAYNDHYGHPAGDEVLRRIARLLAEQQRRPDDLAARYGGEEFVLLLPGADRGAAQRSAEQVLQGLRQLALPHAAVAEGIVTLSLGVAVLHPTVDANPAQLLTAADVALYAAKAGGRNRVAVAPDPSAESHDSK